MAAATPRDLSATTKASLPEGLLEAVREALGPQAAAGLDSSALSAAQQAKRNAEDAEAGDKFGISVALSGDTAVVGAYFDDPNLGGGGFGQAGSAYVVVETAQTPTATVTPTGTPTDMPMPTSTRTATQNNLIFLPPILKN